jgi:sec-independent protein translocase protein TatB
MFELGWAELLVVGVVALIIVGPKDLPKLFRTLGQFMGKARAMAREFSSAMNAAADDADVGDLKKMGDDLRSATSAKNMGLDGLDKVTTKFEDWAPDPDADAKKGPNTAKMTEERRAQAEKIQELTAQKQKERQEREAGAVPAEATLSPASEPAPEPELVPAPASKKAAPNDQT